MLTVASVRPAVVRTVIVAALPEGMPLTVPEMACATWKSGSAAEAVPMLTRREGGWRSTPALLTATV